MEKTFLSENEVVYVIQQLLSAIKFCSEKGISHKDIRPENILVKSVSEDNKIDIKIANFDNMIFLHTNSKPYETVNPVYYLAPEMLLGTQNDKCDLWSIGVIAYLLISGTLPFNGTNDEVLSAIKKGKFTFSSK